MPTMRLAAAVLQLAEMHNQGTKDFINILQVMINEGKALDEKRSAILNAYVNRYDQEELGQSLSERMMIERAALIAQWVNGCR